MRTIFIVLVCCLGLFGCQNGGSTNQGNSDTIEDSLALPWQVDYEKKLKTKNEIYRDEDLAVDSLLIRLNRKYPEIQLHMVKMSNDTLYLEIKDSYNLTEGIGTYGAKSYIADNIINLTTVSGIRYVNIFFEDGSHLGHGTWSKDDFKDFRSE